MSELNPCPLCQGGAANNQCGDQREIRLFGLLVGDHITVELALKNRWAIRTHFQGVCLSVAGEWVDEPSPSNRSEEWLLAHRFSSLEAAILAAKSAPNPAG
jgi:hypothetical protein